MALDPVMEYVQNILQRVVLLQPMQEDRICLFNQCQKYPNTLVGIPEMRPSILVVDQKNQLGQPLAYTDRFW